MKNVADRNFVAVLPATIPHCGASGGVAIDDLRPLAKSLVDPLKARRKAMRQAEMAAWQEPIARTASPLKRVRLPATSSFPRPESAESSGESTIWTILAVTAIASVAAMILASTKLLKNWELFVGWVRAALG